MDNVDAVKAVLAGAPSSSFSGTVTRFVWETRRATAGSPAGAILHGGRWNEPGTPALYAAFSRATALREFLNGPGVGDDFPLPPAAMLSLIVTGLNRVLDLTDEVLLKRLGTSKTELGSLRSPGTIHPAQTLGTIASASFDGLLVWSAVDPAERNLVIFPERFAAPPYVVFRRLV